MMYNYPTFFPFRKLTNYNNPMYYANQCHHNKSKMEKPKESVLKKENISSNNTSNTPNEFLEIFGIKLYFDDILLICLIFFLYNEGVNDQYLFIALILLLLS